MVGNRRETHARILATHHGAHARRPADHYPRSRDPPCRERPREDLRPRAPPALQCRSSSRMGSTWGCSGATGAASRPSCGSWRGARPRRGRAHRAARAPPRVPRAGARSRCGAHGARGRAQLRSRSDRWYWRSWSGSTPSSPPRAHHQTDGIVAFLAEPPRGRAPPPRRPRRRPPRRGAPLESWHSRSRRAVRDALGGERRRAALAQLLLWSPNCCFWTSPPITSTRWRSIGSRTISSRPRHRY